MSAENTATFAIDFDTTGAKAYQNGGEQGGKVFRKMAGG